MSNVAKLKKQAAEFELRKQFDKALAVYVKLLESFDEHAAELDVALFNRVGDLMLRNGNVADAVDYYEQGVDRYSDSGFFNNAIALCNKILRHSPGRASVYYKLGKISALKGFKNDARVNFLEYADRMQKAGKVDEAFRALKEFADLCPEQDEIRLMLADQLGKIGRKDEAVEQLQILHERYDSEGRTADAAATAKRIRAIDPKVEPRAAAGDREGSGSDLIFLDVNAPPQLTPPIPAPAVRRPPRAAAPKPAAPLPPPKAEAAPAPAPPEPEIEPRTAELPATESVQAAGSRLFETPMEGITRIGDDVLIVDKTPSESLQGLESSTFHGDDELVVDTPGESLLDIVPTALDPIEPTLIDDTSLTDETLVRDEGPEPSHLPQETAARHSGSFDFVMAEPDPVVGTEPELAAFDFSPVETPAASVPTVPFAASDSPATSSPDGSDLPFVDVGDPASAMLPSVPVDGSTRGRSLDRDFVIDSNTMPDFGSSEEGEDPLSIEDDELIITSTPSVAHPSTTSAVHSVELLKASVERNPDDWTLRRELAEAMLDAGDREGGIRELETTMSGAERAGDLDLASSLAEEIARLEPEVVRHHQKRVEYAFRTNDRTRLIDAYLALADSLLWSNQSDKARTVYQRVLDLAPDEIRAQSALQTITPPEPMPVTPRSSVGRRPQVPMKPTPARPVGRTVEASDRSFVNLGDWLRDEQAPKDTRMVVAEQEPTGDEDADFADMLRKFKQGVAENVDPDDYQAHYDLAIAYKEMGLLDEAIAEFQKALASPVTRLPTYEALGQCFLEKGQSKLASSILSRALVERASEDQLLGVLYWLGRAAEEQGNSDEALGYYQRVFVLDIQFRDIADRMSQLERVAR
jgi:tetratricopeptide (TPR) repeat protein